MTPGIARASGAENPDRRLSGEQTDSAADAQQIDVPSHDEQRVRNTHYARITCNGAACPGSVRHVDGAKRHIRRHTTGNQPAAAAIPAPRRASALAEPAERRLGPRILGIPRRRLVLAVAPGAARALLVVPSPARNADHVSIVRLGRWLLLLFTGGTCRV